MRRSTPDSAAYCAAWMSTRRPDELQNVTADRSSRTTSAGGAISLRIRSDAATQVSMSRSPAIRISSMPRETTSVSARSGDAPYQLCPSRGEFADMRHLPTGTLFVTLFALQRYLNDQPTLGV